MVAPSRPGPAELGLLSDSSIDPVRHDRYGGHRAPRRPFLARGQRQAILERPPATLRLPGVTVPAGGGGSFRLLRLGVLERALAQAGGAAAPLLQKCDSLRPYLHPDRVYPRVIAGHI
jgi:hypothetical protein